MAYPQKGYRFTLCLLLMLLHVGSLGLAQASFSESPMLASRVSAGDLPPVNERLPLNPMVVEPVESIGTYGGTWQSSLLGAGDWQWLNKILAYEYLVRWDFETNQIIPNIAESFEVNDDATEYTFYLREGMHWSDGHPFTADDIMFWYEDVLLNEELTPIIRAWLTSDGEPVVVEKSSDYSVTFRFAKPNGFFLQSLSSFRNITPISSYPRHYLERYHARYNPNIEQLVRDEGFDDWVSMFLSKTLIADRWRHTGMPTHYPWNLTVPYDGSSTQVVAERNPYYFKVDPEGNQLPYIDQIVLPIVESAEVMLLMALAGEIDFTERHITNNINKPVLFDGQERGGYRFFDTTPSLMNVMIIYFNLTHRDPTMREIFQNRDFRIGLSHAIDRQEIIDLIYLGQGERYQAAPRPESEFYSERMAKQYMEYDPALANEYLDAAGYAARDGDGFRLGPDGRRIVFTVMAPTDFTPQWIDVLEVIQGHWSAVGIDMQVQPVARNLLQTRNLANEHDAVVWRGDGGSGIDFFLEPVNYLPLDANYKPIAVPWTRWWLGQDGAEEPPAFVQRQYELYNELNTTADPVRHAEIMNEILEIATEQFYVIGISLEPVGYGLVRNDFRNVPNTIPVWSQIPTPAVTNPEQYYLARP